MHRTHIAISTIDSYTIYMRIGELSSRSGLSVAAIKYYMRAGLLHPGEKTSHNQTNYDKQHLARLLLIRALLQGGDLTVAAAKTVLEAIESSQLTLIDVFGIAQNASSQVPAGHASDESQHLLDTILSERGWNIDTDNPGYAMATHAIDGFLTLGRPDLIDVIPTYAAAMDRVAQADVSTVGSQHDRDHNAKTIVVGTVLGDSILAGLRRIAQEHYSRKALAGQADPHKPDTSTPTAG